MNQQGYTSFCFCLKDAVRRTYKELKKQNDDFSGFVTDVRFGHYK